MIGPERLREFEPHAHGIKALHVPETGIIDYKKVAEAYADEVRAKSGDIRTSHRVAAILERDNEFVLQTTGGDYRTRYLINCCGLESDVHATMIASADHAANRQEQHGIIPVR